uniref:Uncharacterized protein n=1 Tax=Populus alba TaxID=43335 RepID=A0A4U5PQE2_POPAL|nr:hypothetical protein D5086_0000192240 [Populus alba]
MHDSGWLIFDFSSESEMLDVLGAGPYVIFGRPLVLQIMSDFFDFRFNKLTTMPTWQLVYESLPRFCKQCKSLGHSILTCTKGHAPRNRKRSHDNSACSTSSSPSAETAAFEKQDPYCAGPFINHRKDPMSTEVAAVDPPSTQPHDRKRSKADGSESSDSIPRKMAAASKPTRRQYLTCSKAAATSRIGLPNSPTVSFQSLYSSDSSAPSSIF